MNMDTLRILGMVIGWGALFAGMVGSYWKLRMADQAQEKDIEAVAKSVEDLEKEYIKELNDVDSKMERAFKLIKESSERREELKKEYLTIDKHKDLCKVSYMQLEKVIQESGDKIQAKVEETIVDFQKEMKTQIDAVLAAVQANGKVRP